jgi:hypothetical protein
MKAQKFPKTLNEDHYFALLVGNIGVNHNQRLVTSSGKATFLVE